MKSRFYPAIFATALLTAGCATTTVKTLPTGYVFVFNGFKAEEVNRVEEYLVGFKGYRHHRPITSSMRQVEYWYKTESLSAQLNRNLRQMLVHLGVKGRVTFSENQFEIQKIGLRN